VPGTANDIACRRESTASFADEEAPSAAEADALFRELLTLDPAHVGGALGLAALLESQQDVPGALDALAAALKLHPDHPELLLARAGVRRRRKDLIEAESDVRRVLRAAPSNPDALMELGLVLLRKGLAAEAGQVLMRRVEQRPDDADAHHESAVAFYNLKNYPAAKAHAIRAAELGSPLSPGNLQMLDAKMQSLNPPAPVSGNQRLD
jgi:tetratricopeptide (TPR) repeat protein